jgi:DNA-binding response OmpR family regulator
MKRRKQILVVDDDPSARVMLKQVLAGEGYRVRSAKAAAALEAAKTAPPDLVLLDLKPREQNGWDVFGRLNRKWPLLPVVVITARPNQLFTALAAGVGALLEKPFHIPHMLQTIRHLLREPAETRLARAAGKRAQFHYLPAWPNAQAGATGAAG